MGCVVAWSCGWGDSLYMSPPGENPKLAIIGLKAMVATGLGGLRIDILQESRLNELTAGHICGLDIASWTTI